MQLTNKNIRDESTMTPVCPLRIALAIIGGHSLSSSAKFCNLTDCNETGLGKEGADLSLGNKGNKSGNKHAAPVEALRRFESGAEAGG